MTQEQMIQCIYNDMQEMKQDIKELRQDVEVLKQEMKEVRKDVEALKQDVEVLKQDVEVLKEETTDAKYQIKSIQLTLENVINPNISIVAENHLDLSRKLSEAIKVENEKELFVLRVNRLEDDVRILKHKVGIA